MTTEFNVACLEGQSTNRPPLFNGNNFSYWKARRRIFLQCIDIDIIDVALKKFVEPTDRALKDKNILKKLNVKAMNTLQCGFTPNEFNRVSPCLTSLDIWENCVLLTRVHPK